MKIKKIRNTYIVRLEKGEEVMKTLKKCCEENNIACGSIVGIGGTCDASIQWYDSTTKKFISKKLPTTNYEITSLIGNVSLVDGKPFLHIHITLSDETYHTFGGHLESAVIGVTGEIIINAVDERISRKYDEKFGLKFLDL